jgi:hypothetical protein
VASRRITIHDLTEDSVSEDNAPVITKSPIDMTRERPARGPLEVLQNNAKPVAKALSPALKSAIATLSESRIRRELEILLSQHDAARCYMEEKLLVKGRELSRYHADSDSETENRHEEEEEEEEEESETNSQHSNSHTRRIQNSMLPIPVADDEWTPRYAKCQNCKNLMSL